MAFNRKNFLKRVIDTQEIYLEHCDSGLSNREIFKQFIEPCWIITERTFYKYLAIPAKRDLKRIEEIENSQKSLF